MNKHVVNLAETDSTNIYIRRFDTPKADEMVVVTTDFQTAGRGQGDHHWESEPGQNLLCSILVSPSSVAPARQFLLSEAGALAVGDALADYVEDITLKWPNDIYWKDRKISGTLIETALSGGQLQRCVFGIGVNLNQQQFHSDAPNPVSLRQIIGCETDRSAFLDRMLQSLEQYLDMLYAGKGDQMAILYHERLYRRKGFHTYSDRKGVFQAEILGVADSGHLMLRDTDAQLRSYAFKEVQFVI